MLLTLLLLLSAGKVHAVKVSYGEHFNIYGKHYSTGAFKSPPATKRIDDNHVIYIWSMLALHSKKLLLDLNLTKNEHSRDQDHCYAYVEVHNKRPNVTMRIGPPVAKRLGIIAQKTKVDEPQYLSILTPENTARIKLFTNCSVNNSLIVTLYVNWSVQENPTFNPKKPNLYYFDCPITDYMCPNKECISYGYICDNSDDCGCEIDGCDESDCHAKLLTDSVRLSTFIGTFVGFCFAIIIIAVWDRYDGLWGKSSFADNFKRRTQPFPGRKQRQKRLARNIITTWASMNAPGFSLAFRQAAKQQEEQIGPRDESIDFSNAIKEESSNVDEAMGMLKTELAETKCPILRQDTEDDISCPPISTSDLTV